jgi:hypothetical protein
MPHGSGFSRSVGPKVPVYLTLFYGNADAKDSLSAAVILRKIANIYHSQFNHLLFAVRNYILAAGVIQPTIQCKMSGFVLILNKKIMRCCMNHHREEKEFITAF